jgi:hypothetical protein
MSSREHNVKGLARFLMDPDLLASDCESIARCNTNNIYETF